MYPDQLFIFADQENHGVSEEGKDSERKSMTLEGKEKQDEQIIFRHIAGKLTCRHHRITSKNQLC
jgi:hypothetical protein